MKRLLPIPCLVFVLATHGSDRVGEESSPALHVHPALVDRLEGLEAEGDYLDLWGALGPEELAAFRAYRQPDPLPSERHLPPARRSDYVDLHARARTFDPRRPPARGR